MRTVPGVLLLALATGCPPKDPATEAPAPATTAQPEPAPVEPTPTPAATAEPEKPKAPAGDATVKQINDAAAMLDRGDAASAQQAITILEQVIQKDPSNAVALFNLGVAKQILGDYGNARKYYSSAIEADKTLGQAWLYLGLLQAAAGNNDMAAATWRTGIDNDPTNMELRVALITMYRDAGKTDDAIREAQAALRINANSLPIYNNLGLAYMDKGELELAKFVYMKAMQGIPSAEQNAYIRANLGWIYHLRGEKGPALFHLQEAVKLDPGLVPALVYLSTIYMDDRNYGDSVPLLETAIKKEPENHGALLNLGIAYRGLGRLDDAKKMYDKALLVDPTNPDPYFNLGILYGDYLKQYDESIKSFEKYVSSGGTDRDLAKTYIEDIQKEKKRADKKREADRRKAEQEAARKAAEAAKPPEPPPEQPAPEQAPPEQPAPEGTGGQDPWGGDPQ